MIGKTVSQYLVLEHLGAGGMGEVYLARDLRLGRKVALKVLPPEQACRAAFLERFRREARAAAALQHPNIVKIYAVEEAEGIPFLVLELVEGSTLADVIPPHGMPLDRMLRIAVQLADALRAAHERGIIHRDLKPRNLMIDGKDRLKILDFGIAKRLPAEDEPTLIEGRTEEMEALTREGQILGTVSYMSPEQLQGLPLCPRSDLFSVGVILYQMATGRLPFQSSNPADQLMKVLEERAPLPGVVRSGLPRRFDEIVARCLEREPRQRYQSAGVLHDDLADLLREPVSSPRLSSAVPPPLVSRKLLRNLAGGAMLAALALLTGATTPARRAPTGLTASVAGTRALAVLPLKNLSGEQEYFVDGMTDALIASLGNVGQVRVISRQSVMRFKGSDQPLPAIARQLGVDLVLTGSVLRSGTQVWITMSLVQADPEQQVWAETYARDLKDVLALQDEVAREVASQVRMELTDQERSRLSDARPVDPEVYDLHLQGRYYWEKRTEEGLLKAIGYFARAIAKDPDYAPAHAGLADAWSLLGYFRYAPPDLAFERARAEALRALELDGDLAAAHASLGNTMLFRDWNGTRAERELRRALSLNPSNAGVHLSLYSYLSSLGRLNEAEAHLLEAKRLNPLSPAITAALTEYLLMKGDFEAAVEQSRRAIELEPGCALSYEQLWSALDEQGRFAEAFQAHQRALSLWGYPGVAEQAARVYEQSGYRAGLKAAGHALASEPGQVPVHLTAATFARGGDRDEAIGWLERGLRHREPFVLWLRQQREWDGLRGLAEFQRLVSRMEELRSAP